MLANVVFFFAVRAQTLNDDKLPPELLQRMDKGAELMELAKFEEADIEFKYVLDHAPVIPADICYYFGANSFYLDKYKQAINWLSKYIELKGTMGRHFDEAERLLELAKVRYQQESLSLEGGTTSADFQANDEPQEFVITTDIDCGPTGKLICPVCHGKGVIIKNGLFGKEYNTCQYGDEYGYMTCEDYNLLLQGKLKPKKRDY